jgi:hypothetical protein
MLLRRKGVNSIRHSIVASIPACHAGDQGSIPCDGETFSVATGGSPAQYYFFDDLRSEVIVINTDRFQIVQGLP